MTLQVVEFIEGWCMSYIYELITIAKRKKLKPGQCIVAFSNSCRTARIVDCVGVVHDLRCPDDANGNPQAWNTQELSRLLKLGMGCELKFNREDAKSANEAWKIASLRIVKTEAA